MKKIIAYIKERDGYIHEIKVRPNKSTNDFTYNEKTYIIVDRDYSMKGKYRVYCYTYGNPQPVIWETGSVTKFTPEILTAGVFTRVIQNLLDVVKGRLDIAKLLPLINTVLIILLGVLMYFMIDKLMTLLEEILSKLNLILGV